MDSSDQTRIYMKDQSARTTAGNQEKVEEVDCGEQASRKKGRCGQSILSPGLPKESATDTKMRKGRREKQHTSPPHVM